MAAHRGGAELVVFLSAVPLVSRHSFRCVLEAFLRPVTADCQDLQIREEVGVPVLTGEGSLLIGQTFLNRSVVASDKELNLESFSLSTFR